MRLLVTTTLTMILGCSTVWAQSAATLDTPFQVRVVPKLRKADLITLTSTGAVGAASMCAHVYAFEPGGQLVACCSCVVAPNMLRSLALGADVFEGAKPPKAATFDVLGAVTVGGTCNAAAPGALATGILASKGELPFTPSTLSAGELNSLVTRCGFLHATPGICPACRDS